ncbi:MAG TPA: protein kinase [Candidatus Eisenbacteria bacterium]|nr:protein kinase [Candidatus Eisenbacteria bacterium]
MTETLGAGARLGHYRIRNKLGSGGMGEVYRAEDLRLERHVAIKVLARSDAADRTSVDRLLREAKLASSLSHPGIVTVHSVEEADQTHFLVMELVEGETLRDRLARAPLPLEEIVSLGAQTAEALDAAHRAGLIHRDVKSTNILVTPEGRAKVADFGLAKRLPGSGTDADVTAMASLTATGAIVGTVSYMSPEQSRGESLDARTDIFSLGVVLYEAATGRLPFEGPTTLTVLHEIALVEPPAPSRVRAGLPRSLDHVILRAMAKKRERRFETAGELARALRDLLQEDATSGRDLARAGVTAGSPSGRQGRVRNNLPVPLTSFVGRHDEMEEASRLLETHRLVTLAGAGGCGKSRLSIHVARNVLESFPDGVWLVELASLSDPGLLPQRIAAAMGVREEPDRPVLETLGDALSERTVLILLDNCEHMTSACASVAASLLDAAPAVRILATSREPVGVPGESLLRVPPLETPDPARQRSRRELGRFESVRLFVERAAAASPSFALNDENAATVGQICARLDGIPLAIELAAARIRVLPVPQILVRLEDRFRLLTSGGAALPHHQTLRATVDWSYELLSEPERALFDRLSCFAGGATLEAVEAICSGDGIAETDVLDLLANLVDKSLVVPETGAGNTARYRLLETLRAYGAERLDRAGHRETVAARHARTFLGLAEESEPKLSGGGESEWLARLEEEHDNLRRAGGWLLEAGHAEELLRLVGALWRFWRIHGHLGEGRRRIEAALALPDGDRAPYARAKALLGAAALARSQGDYETASTRLQEALPIARATGNRETAASILNEMGNVADDQSKLAEAEARFQECLAIRRELGDRWGMAMVLHNLGVVAQGRLHFEEARALYTQSIGLSREVGWLEGEGGTRNALGSIELDLGNHEAARQHHEAALAIHRKLGSRPFVAYSLREQGRALTGLGRHSEARRLLTESIETYRALGDLLGTVETLEHFAVLDAGEERDERALLLAGAADAQRSSLGAPRSEPDRENLERSLKPARDRLGLERSASATEAGSAMPLDRAIVMATEELHKPLT